MLELTQGYYHLCNPNESEPTLVHYYNNPDTGEWGFGFNIHDGGGFLPAKELCALTHVVPVVITSVLRINPNAPEVQSC